LSLFVCAARKQRNNASQPYSESVAYVGAKKAHCLFKGLQYAVPSVLPIRNTLTRQGAPEVLIGTANGTGVNEGIGVLAFVAVTPTPTST
jgi:hypothetical protein